MADTARPGLRRTRPSPVIVAAAALLVVESTLFVISNGASALNFLQLGVALILGVLMLRGSRIAWIITLLGSSAQLLNALSEPQEWPFVGATAILVLLLLAPSTIRFVWIKRDRRPFRLGPSAIRRLSERVEGVLYLAFARVAQWEWDVAENQIRQPRTYGVLLWRLAVVIVFLLILVGAIHTWQEGTARDSAIVEVLIDVTWTVYMVTQIVFLVLLALTVYGWWTRRTPVKHGSERRRTR